MDKVLTAVQESEPVFENSGKTKRKNRVFLFRALQHRNYRLYFLGQGISLVGSWMQQVAVMWLVYRLTDSAFLLGVVGFLSQIPNLFLSPFVGVLADRWNRHTMFIATQIFGFFQALVLAALVLSGHIVFWHLIPLSLFLGIVNAVDAPVRQSFVVQMVGKRDLDNAITLNSALFNGARLVGPALAGILVASVGEGYCFLINALSYSGVLGALVAMRITPQRFPAVRSRILSGLQEGIEYAYRSLTIKTLLLLIAFTSLVGMSYIILLPVFAGDVLSGGPKTLGMLYSATGIGALIGALFLVTRKSLARLLTIVAGSSVIFSLGIIGFSFSRWIPVSLAMMVFVGFGMMVQMISCNTILQTIVDDDKRGRIMSLYAVSFMGIIPLGNLIFGSVAHATGAPACALLCGVLCLAGTVVFAFRVRALQADVRTVQKSSEKFYAADLP